MKRLFCILLSILVFAAFLVPGMPAHGTEDFTLSVGAVQGAPGQLVQVPLTLTGNPGIISIKVTVAYNPRLLTLEQVESGDFKGVSFGPLTANPIAVNWMNALQGNNTANGVLAILTFRITAEESFVGETPITLTANPKDIFNADFVKQPLTLAAGSVKILGNPPVQTTPTPSDVPTPPQTPTDVVYRQLGDVDIDGKITAKDALAVLKATVGKITLDLQIQRLADCNGDGLVNAKDALQILRYCVNKGSSLDQYFPIVQ